MQRKSADFARLHVILSSIQEELKSCKLSSAVWCDAVTATVTILETEHGIVVTAPTGMTRRSITSTESVSDIGQLQRSVAIPYIELLLENIQNRFLTKQLKFLLLLQYSVLSFHYPNPCPHMVRKKSECWPTFMDRR